MCNLYRMTKPQAEVARLFGVSAGQEGNAGEEIYPGYPGLVIAADGLRTMHWGFPLALRGKSGQMLKPKPVNNARTDKLATSFWKSSFVARRCLIPTSAWAEAEGPNGAKTRSWFSLADRELFALAGIWRWSDEWGEDYSMIITEAHGIARQVHARMPVVLEPESHAQWLSGSPQQAFDLCRPYEGELALDRTSQPWKGEGRAAALSDAPHS